LTLLEISNTRLLNQKIEASTLATAKEVVSRMGAMQAQDFAMAKWAIGQRMLNASDEKVESALNEAEIIRTHVLRPTWHFVTADDIYWMLALTAPRIRSSMKSRDRDLELTAEVYNKSFNILQKKLSGGINLTRDEIAQFLNDANIKTDNNRLSHILMGAELESLVCSGRKTGNKLTYGLLAERVTNRKILSKEESLAELAKKYFTSHGPATLKDFAWWSGLAVGDAAKALNSVKTGFISETHGSEVFWFYELISNHVERKTSLHLLPAFDEFLISYKDRSASLANTHNKKAVSDNGIFYPVVILNGQVAGKWKRISKKDKVEIEINLFADSAKITNQLLEKEALLFGQFLNKEVEIIESKIAG
jgi:hypothetical protein